jgi:ABC-type histidine transport system ATPase subunit
MPFAREIADEMIFFDDGAIVETGSPEQFFTNPQSERAQKFMTRLIKRTRRE